MEHRYINYLDYFFVLAIYEEGISLERLLFHIEPGQKAGPDTRSQALKALSEMEATGLVDITCQAGRLSVALTAPGRKLSEELAAILADSMVRGWRAQQVDFPTQKVANY